MVRKSAAVSATYEHPLRAKRRQRRPKSPGTLIVEQGSLVILHFNKLPVHVRQELVALLVSRSVQLPEAIEKVVDLRLRLSCSSRHGPITREVVPQIGRLISTGKKRASVAVSNAARPALSAPRILRDRPILIRVEFNHVNDCVKRLSQTIKNKHDEVAALLNEYECYNVALDEIARSCDLLDNLEQNRAFFVARTGLGKAYLPSNQPLYALVCFGVVPAFLTEAMVVRPPQQTWALSQRLAALLKLNDVVPNLGVCAVDRAQFTSERLDETDFVIFTGTSDNAHKVRAQYPNETLFILNGAGHNPVVVTPTACISKAVESTLRVCLHNQGQDCAAPNAVLVHRDVSATFIAQLLAELEAIEPRVGPYDQRTNIVGPNSRLRDVPEIVKAVVVTHRKWRVHGGRIDPDGTIHPTLLVRPLADGPGLTEFFAPVVLVQPYDSDADLALYFHHPNYSRNAMYVSVFGKSEFIDSLIAVGLHSQENILLDTDLHIVERGFLPYGGSGEAASSLWIRGQRMAKATLPQRDIFEHIILPLLENERAAAPPLPVTPPFPMSLPLTSTQ